jgi:hypothetical protein
MWVWLLVVIGLGLSFMVCRDAECWSDGKPVSPRPERSTILTYVLVAALCICFVGALISFGSSRLRMKAICGADLQRLVRISENNRWSCSRIRGRSVAF